MSSRPDRETARSVGAAAIAVTAILSTASASGGYFPIAWGWAGLALAVATAAALVLLQDVETSRLELVALGGLGALVSWEGLSALWSASPPRSILELQRDLVYLAALTTLLLLTSRRTASTLVTAALVGSAGVCLWGLATRVTPEHFPTFSTSTGQLARPVGYWNSLGILATIALLLTLGVASAEGRRRVSAAALVPPLLVTLYLTFSRGAIIALALGVVLLVALHPRRGRAAATVAALAVPGAAAVLLASRVPALRQPNVPLETVSHAGHRLGLELVLLTALAAAAAVAVDRAAARWSPRLRLPPRILAAAAAGAAVAALVGLVLFAGRVVDAFRSPTVTGGADLNARLLSASGNARADYWRIAWRDVEAHPLLGSGAGTYELSWNLERPNVFGARDAHNLYVEKLAELGPVGLVLLGLALAPPFLALRKRRGPLEAAAGAGYAAFVAHAAVDWDWEVPTVTLTALCCGVVLLAWARPEASPRPLRSSVRAAGLAVAAAVALFALVGYVGSSALDESAHALRAGDLTRAERAARRAARLQPWQSEPWSALGEAQLTAGRQADAARSFRHAVRKDEADWFPWYELAVAENGAKRRHAALEGLKRNPRSPELVLLRNQ